MKTSRPRRPRDIFAERVGTFKNPRERFKIVKIQPADAPPEKGDAPIAALRTVARVTALLELLAESVTPMRLTDIARRLCLPLGSAHNLIHRLADLGYVETSGEGRAYQVGPKLVRLALCVTERLDIEQVARPLIAALAAQTREDVYLAIPQRKEIIYVAKVEGSESLRLNIRIGIPRPLHSTSVGKLLLAMLPDDEVDAYLKKAPFEAFTAATKTTSDALLREIKEIRIAGYALSEQETVEGICALGIPIFGGRGRFAAAISISAPMRRFNLRREQLIKEGCATAMMISKLLGSSEGTAHGVA